MDTPRTTPTAAEEENPVAGRRPGDRPSPRPRTLNDVPPTPGDQVDVPLDPADTGTHHLPPAADQRAIRLPCPDCEGRGYVTKTVNDLLRESLALLGPGQGGDDVIREFYRRLLTAAPSLAPLFPADLLHDDTIKGQRDRLLKAIKALADWYDPGNPDGMGKLDTALRSFGRAHAAFARPDGSIRGATLDEYVAVKNTLFGTLTDAAGSAWVQAYTDAWSEAYDYAAIVMLDEQRITAGSFPRYPRPAQ